MYPIGLSTCGAPVTPEMLTAIRDGGVTHVELSYNKAAYDGMDVTATAAMIRESGLIAHSLHLPFSRELDISLPDPALREAAMACQTDLMKRSAAAGIPLFVIHPSSEPISDHDRPARMAQAKESLAVLTELAVSLGVTLAVEDLPRTCLGNCSREMLELLTAHPALRSCFDTNHLLGEDAADYIFAVGDRIVTTHVSDYDFLNERHWLPGEGKQDFLAILSAFREVGYKGPWLYELGLVAPKTIVRPRPLTYADFGENARTLFAGKNPAPVGTPVEGLGMWA
jgi:sugar phosphate isomerase/epimerase